MLSLDRAPGWPTAGAYRVARPLFRGFFRLYFDFEVRYEERVPRQGPYVIAPNHLSFVDPLFSSLVAHTNIRYLAVDGLFGRSRIFDGIAGFVGTIPVQRDRVPVGALRAAVRTLHGGHPVGVYPESRRVDCWGDSSPPANGAAWLGLLTGAPIFPIAIEGSELVMSHRQPKFRRTAVRVTVCEAIEPLEFLDRVDPLTSVMRQWELQMAAVLGPGRTLK